MVYSFVCIMIRNVNLENGVDLLLILGRSWFRVIV